MLIEMTALMLWFRCGNARFRDLSRGYERRQLGRLAAKRRWQNDVRSHRKARRCSGMCSAVLPRNIAADTTEAECVSISPSFQSFWAFPFIETMRSSARKPASSPAEPGSTSSM